MTAAWVARRWVETCLIGPAGMDGLLHGVLEVADIFRDHGAAWRRANAGHVSLDQLKVMSAIERCRTVAHGPETEIDRGAAGRGPAATGGGSHPRGTRAQLWRRQEHDFTALVLIEIL